MTRIDMRHLRLVLSAMSPGCGSPRCTELWHTYVLNTSLLMLCRAWSTSSGAGTQRACSVGQQWGASYELPRR